MVELSFESTTPMTQSDFFGWAGDRSRWDLHHYELLNGRVVMNPPAGYPHGSIGSRLQRVLSNFVVDHAVGEVFDSSQGFELPSGDTLEPDASFVSRERWQSAPLPEPGKFLRVVPDLVVEIISASTASRDRGEKKAIYERNRVREYWLLDWRTRELTLFNLVGDRFDEGTVWAERDLATSKVLAGLSFRVGELLPSVG
jgi:Uma2 family endonuclease